jgi:hypothetical protein
MSAASLDVIRPSSGISAISTAAETGPMRRRMPLSGPSNMTGQSPISLMCQEVVAAMVAATISQQLEIEISSRSKCQYPASLKIGGVAKLVEI